MKIRRRAQARLFRFKASSKPLSAVSKRTLAPQRVSTIPPPLALPRAPPGRALLRWSFSKRSKAANPSPTIRQFSALDSKRKPAGDPGTLRHRLCSWADGGHLIRSGCVSERRFAERVRIGDSELLELWILSWGLKFCSSRDSPTSANNRQRTNNNPTSILNNALTQAIPIPFARGDEPQP